MNITQDSGRKFSVAFKILFFIVVTGLIVFSIHTGINIYQALQQNKVVAQQSLMALYEHYNDETEAIEQASAALSTSFADRSDIRELFLAKDREGLLALLTPVFNVLATDYNTTHLYVHQPDGVVFARIHNPQKFGDDITYRQTTAVTLQSQETTSGVEIGSSRLGVRSVSPLFHQGEFVGMIEVGLDYDRPFVEKLKADHNADFNLWISTAAAAPAGLGPNDETVEPPLSELFYYTGTSSPVLPIPAEIYRKVLQSGEPEMQFVSIDNQELAVLIAPILGYDDQIIGILEISRSRTDALVILLRDQLIILLVAVGLSMLTLGLIWIVIYSVVLRPLGHLTTVARRQLEGNLNTRIELLPNDEFGQLGHTFNTLSKELDQTLKNQKDIIAERTNQLQVALEVARSLSSILDIEQLLEEVVNLIHDRFNLYHTHIYLLDEDRHNLVVAKGYGEAGAKMKERDYNISLQAQKSVMARAARFGKVVRIDNVRVEDGWLPNPLLPETRSEMAVPVKLGEQVIGVLDVQSSQESAFDEQFAITLSAVADEIAVTIRNAQIFTETTQALAEAQKLQELYTQSGWQAYKARQKTSSYQQVQPGAAPIDENLLTQVKQHVAQGQTVDLKQPITDLELEDGNGKSKIQSALAAPLAIRGQVIGHIRIHDTEQGRQWAAEEIALLESISEQMSLAIENARLFDDTQQRATREQLTREITDKMRVSPDVDSIINTGLAELARILGVSRTYVKLISKLEEGE